ncbi:Crp/Fnr family transcriptional regulator [Niveispirillum sp.]|uniref:Crp/Fnr family transcriptional regulator n=1 Tax=Niveispirillum sp. TaxID=1917217 RepID=UPI001B43BE0C|nr:Crp/Fnr family transcriptional regulator [Niveispirillum sp.]MBP7335233.1 Crp/Fnr family transcriptional regulator [Niveispirillum sp.]
MLIPATRPPALLSGTVPLLETDPWFAGLPPACRGWLAAAAARRTLAEGERAYRVGGPPDGLYRVLSGGVRLISYPQPGRSLVNLTVPAGRWFGALSTLDGQAQAHDAVAMGRTALLHLPMADIAALAAVTPDLHRHITLLACQQQRAAIEHVGLLLLRSPPARLARLLLDMADGGRLRINREDLAGRIGLSRQGLHQLLTETEQAGLIRSQYGRIDILDPEGLSALAR